MMSSVFWDKLTLQVTKDCIIKIAQMVTSGCNDINIHVTDQLQCGGAQVPYGIPTEKEELL